MTPSQMPTYSTEEVWALAFVEAFRAHPSDECIPWGHKIASNGYGRAGRMYAHRLLYVAVTGLAIGTGLTIDHLCQRKDCVNAAHLEPVTSTENVRRHYDRLATCKHGHPRTEENIVIYKGRPRCLPCSREWSRVQAARQKAARQAAREAARS